MLCEQCGNEFYSRKTVEIEGKKYVPCPYCRWKNVLEYKRKRNKNNKNN